MTNPPQPGQWNPGPPPPRGPQPPQGYYPPPGWSPQPPPHKQGGGLKWLLIGVAVLLVIAISVGITVTVFLARDSSGPNGNTSAASPPGAGDVASASDTGPVALITSEPTCVAWRPIQTALANTLSSTGWSDRDPASASSSWTPQVRAQYEAAGASMRTAADQVVTLAKQTPHRVMREMYEQFIAYGRAYADSLSSYQPKDDELAVANVSLLNAIGGVCNAIDYGGAAARTAPVAVPPPTAPPVVGDLHHPDQFVSGPSASCSTWVKADSATEADLTRWSSLDRSIPATAWDPERRSVEEAAARTFESYATTLEKLGHQQGGTFEDLATLSALYLRVYASTLPTFAPPRDGYLGTPGLRLNSAITSACKAAGGS